MEKICGIYKITSPSGGIYIGQSVDVIRRKYGYSGKAGIGQVRIHNSIMKYGWEAHIFEVIHECSESELNYWEKYYIKYFDCFNTEHGMNLTEGGRDSKMMTQTKIKISNALKGIKRSDFTKEKISITRKIKKIGVGKIPSNETRLKLSDAIKGIKRSETTKLRMKICKTGLIHTEETKLKITMNKSGTYKIYRPNGELFHKIHGNIKKELKKFNLPEHRFCESYKLGTKISGGVYNGWYCVKLVQSIT